MTRLVTSFIVFVAFMSMAFPSTANWKLSLKDSSINFLSVKKTHITENHFFNQFSASITNDGNINLEIDLTSVDTKIAIRNDRMKEHLFNTGVFPTASFSAEIKPELLEKLAVAESKVVELKGVIRLHGQSQDVVLNTLVTKVNHEKLLVVSQHSLIIYAQNFDLIEGINKLQALAKLPSITHSVPVNFVLTFTR